MATTYSNNSFVDSIVNIAVNLLDDVTSRRFISVVLFAGAVLYLYSIGIQVPISVLIIAGAPLTVWIVGITIRDIVVTLVTKNAPSESDTDIVTDVSTPDGATTSKETVG